jgi:hypothetical protein
MQDKINIVPTSMWAAGGRFSNDYLKFYFEKNSGKKYGKPWEEFGKTLGRNSGR